MKFSEYLTEELLLCGGWASTLSQHTKLTPQLVDEALKLTEQFFKAFNKKTKKDGFPEIEFLGPVGSVSYHKEDMIKQPEKEYGDIDTLVSIPKNDAITDSANVTEYLKRVHEFVKTCNFPYILDYEIKPGSYINIKVGEDVVQVDMIFTFEQVKDWAKARYTPEHNVKGALMGNLLSALGELFDFSIQGYGVQAKLIDGVIVPYNTRKVLPIIITKDPKRFMIDILKHFNNGKEVKVSKLLQNNSGFKDNIKISMIADSIRGLARSITENGLWGKGQLAKFKNEDQFLKAVSKAYLDKMATAIASSKFDKAATLEVKEKAVHIKDMFDTKSKEIAKLLVKED